MSARGKKGSKRGKTPDVEGSLVVTPGGAAAALSSVATAAAAGGGSSSESVVIMTSSSSSSSSIKNSAVVNGSSIKLTTSSSSSSSNVSPSRMSRVQEKEELQTLNDRFANYIERARNLEAENLQLSVQLTNAKELHTQVGVVEECGFAFLE